ncbi:PP2C family protein-serine/threonine phosphatase [Acidobacteriota bacterium]
MFKKLNSFRVIVTARVLLLSAAIFFFLYFLRYEDYLVSKVFLGVLIPYLIYGLIHFSEKTNRDLNRFLQSIQSDDFTQNFPNKGLGDSFDNLRKSFNKVSRQFLKLRSEKETQFRYLQTVVRHVRAGLISYRQDGSVELLNKAAKEILNITHLKNIKALEQFSKPLVKKLLTLKAGENASLKIDSNEKPLYLSINATQFKTGGELYTLVTLQDIQVEIEKEHMAKELEIAWNVQKSLLPQKDPDIPGFDIAGMCQPAEEVGGDYYDFIPLGQDKLVMIIADVSGKGTPAAFYMTLTKGFIQSYIKEDISPKEMLINVNRQMVETIDRKSFVTMFIAILDRNSGKITCARAGHNPGIHYSHMNRKSVHFRPEGIALGLRKGRFFSQTVREYELQLHENDWLILYTDGFIEAVNAKSEEFGEERLKQLVQANPKSSAKTMVSTIFKEVKDFAGSSPQYDDMTIICLKVSSSSTAP